MKTTLLFLILTIPIFAGNEQIQDQLNRANKNFFIENKGQWPSEVKYLAKVGGMNAWITNSGVVYDYFRIAKNYNESETLKMTRHKKEEFEKKNTSIKGHAVKMQLVDVNASSVQQGNNKQKSYYNYFIGNDKSKWASYVPLYGDVEQDNIYKNINVKYYFDGNSIRYDYIVKPGADLSKLRLKFEGQESVRTNDAGEIVIKTSLGEVTNGKLYSYQTDNGIKTEVNCKFVLNVDGTINLNASSYDKEKDLIIDPLVYSTFIGGSNNDYGRSIAIDAGGNAYITGYTASTNYPTTPGAYDSTYLAGNDAFVTKLNSTGTALVYSTYMGGNDDDSGNSIAVDASGYAYITGYTKSTNYPTTSGAYQTNGGGSNNDAFVTKLNSTGSALVYSTYIGGGTNDNVNSITIDAGGNAYITGSTSSSDYPTTPGAYQITGRGYSDAFVTKLNSTGSALVYSTYIGSNNDDYGYSIAVDAGGNVYITGYTTSSDYPTTVGAYQTIGGGNSDAFVTKLYLQPIGNSQTPSTGQNNNLSFGATNILFDMFVSTAAQITSIFYEYASPQSGTLPEGINGVSQYYWTISAPGISFDNGYIKVPVASLRGVNNPAHLVWLKRTNPGDVWTNIGGSIIDGNLVSTVAFSSFSEFAIGTKGDDPLPIQLTSFSAEQDNGNVLLRWETKSEVQNAGFDVERKTASDEQFIKIGFIKGSGNSNTPKQYSFEDNSSQPGNISYRLCQINTDGLVAFSNEIQVNSIPSNYILYQNYPNPFNPSTIIKYTLPFESKVSIKFYNSIGQCIREVNEATMQPGYYSLNFNSSGLASGIYFYSIKAVSTNAKNNYTAVKKMMLLK